MTDDPVDLLAAIDTATRRWHAARTAEDQALAAYRRAAAELAAATLDVEELVRRYEAAPTEAMP